MHSAYGTGVSHLSQKCLSLKKTSHLPSSRPSLHRYNRLFVLRKTPKHLPKPSVAFSSSRPHPFFSSKSAGQQLQTFKGTQSRIVLNKRENISHSTCLLRPLARNKNRRLWAKCIWHGLIEHATATMASNHKTTHVVVNIHSSL